MTRRLAMALLVLILFAGNGAGRMLDWTFDH